MEYDFEKEEFALSKIAFDIAYGHDGYDWVEIITIDDLTILQELYKKSKEEFKKYG